MPPFYRALWDPNVEFTNDLIEASIKHLLANTYDTQYVSRKCIQRLQAATLTDSQGRKITGVLRELIEHGWNRRLVGWLNLVRISDREATIKLVNRYIHSDEPAIMERTVLIGIELFGIHKDRDVLRSRYSRGNDAWLEAKAAVLEAIQNEPKSPKPARRFADQEHLIEE